MSGGGSGGEYDGGEGEDIGGDGYFLAPTFPSTALRTLAAMCDDGTCRPASELEERERKARKIKQKQN